MVSKIPKLQIPSLDNVQTMLSNPFIVGTVVLIAIVYGSMLAPRLPANLALAFENPFFKVLFMMLILLAWKVEPALSLILAIGFILSIQTLTRYRSLAKGVQMANKANMQAAKKNAGSGITAEEKQLMLELEEDDGEGIDDVALESLAAMSETGSVSGLTDVAEKIVDNFFQGAPSQLQVPSTLGWTGPCDVAIDFNSIVFLYKYDIPQLVTQCINNVATSGAIAASCQALYDALVYLDQEWQAAISNFGPSFCIVNVPNPVSSAIPLGSLDDALKATNITLTPPGVPPGVTVTTPGFASSLEAALQQTDNTLSGGGGAGAGSLYYLKEQIDELTRKLRGLRNNEGFRGYGNPNPQTQAISHRIRQMVSQAAEGVQRVRTNETREFFCDPRTGSCYPIRNTEHFSMPQSTGRQEARLEQFKVGDTTMVCDKISKVCVPAETFASNFTSKKKQPSVDVEQFRADGDKILCDPHSKVCMPVKVNRRQNNIEDFSASGDRILCDPRSKVCIPVKVNERFDSRDEDRDERRGRTDEDDREERRRRTRDRDERRGRDEEPPLEDFQVSGQKILCDPSTNLCVAVGVREKPSCDGGDDLIDAVNHRLDRLENVIRSSCTGKKRRPRGAPRSIDVYTCSICGQNPCMCPPRIPYMDESANNHDHDSESNTESALDRILGYMQPSAPSPEPENLNKIMANSLRRDQIGTEYFQTAMDVHPEDIPAEQPVERPAKRVTFGDCTYMRPHPDPCCYTGCNGYLEGWNPCGRTSCNCGCAGSCCQAGGGRDTNCRERNVNLPFSFSDCQPDLPPAGDLDYVIAASDCCAGSQGPQGHFRPSGHPGTKLGQDYCVA